MNRHIILIISIAAASVLAEIFLYLGFFKGINSFGKYIPYIIYLVIAVSLGGAAMHYVKLKRKELDCPTGMMVGMTIGMLSGFIFGAIIGATNGMFVGSVYGIIVGMAAGSWSMRSCGIMPIMEGMMAGLMGGIMGAMTSIMMISDNIALFMPILVGSSGIILYGMVKMISEHDSEQASLDHSIIVVSGLAIFSAVSTILMVYGPKSVIVI